jgi:hypothetical protein
LPVALYHAERAHQHDIFLVTVDRTDLYNTVPVLRGIPCVRKAILYWRLWAGGGPLEWLPLRVVALVDRFPPPYSPEIGDL